MSRTLTFLLLSMAILMLPTGCRPGDDDAPMASETAVPAHTDPGQSKTAAASTTTAATDMPPPRAQAGTYDSTIDVGDSERRYRVYVPDGLMVGEAVPLVIGLHGGLGTGTQFARNTRFDEQADDAGFIAVFPDGIGRTWNGGRCCGVAARLDIDDVEFISRLIDQLALDYPIDAGRVYATGHSNGAIMAFRLACELSEKVVAVGGVAGSLEIPDCAPDRPASVLLIHGDADENHPLEGGEGSDSIAGVAFTSVAESMETLSSAMACSTEVTGDATGALTTTDWQGCPRGVDVRLVVVGGASHAWPGGTGGVLLGEASDEIDATATVWEFLSSHTR